MICNVVVISSDPSAVRRVAKNTKGADKYDFWRLDPAEDVYEFLDQIPENAPCALVYGDVLVQGDWLQGLLAAMEQTQVMVREDDFVALSNLCGSATIGAAVPVMDKTWVAAQHISLTKQESALGFATYARDRFAHFGSAIVLADAVDPGCIVLHQSLVHEIKDLPLNAPMWAGKTIGLLLERLNMRAAVCEGVFSSRDGTGKASTAEDRLVYLRTPTGRSSICLAQIVSLQTYGDLVLWRNTLPRNAALADKVVCLVTGNPGKMFHGRDPEEMHKTIPKADARMIRSCMRAKTPDTVLGAIAKWAEAVAGKPVSIIPPKNEDPRVTVARAANDAGCGWVLALDSHEMLEDRLTSGFMETLALNPDPNVRAYDMGILTHWDSPRLVREDQPFGDGGTFTGGDHDVFMWRASERLPALGRRGPHFAEDSILTAGVRVRRFKYMNAADRGQMIKAAREAGIGGPLVGALAYEQNMKISRYEPRNGIGVHMLAYSQEDPEDIARWMADVYALAEHGVIVWTEDTFEPDPVLVDLCCSYGFEFIHHPLADNIAEARNAGINHLHQYSETLGWAVFFDPDEWLSRPAEEMRIIRRLAEAGETWGWLFRFANYRAEKDVPTISDCVRMSKLDVAGRMRMSGRVHESFDRAANALKKTGIQPNMTYAPFVMNNRGMSYDEERMAAKLDHYEKLCRLELEDHPDNQGIWVSLGWHYANEGDHERAEECYRRALHCADGSYLPFKEFGYMRLRQARSLFANCEQNLVKSHPFYELCTKINDFLGKVAPPHPIVNRGERKTMAELPPPPPGYDADEVI